MTTKPKTKAKRPTRTETRAERNIRWIEENCRIPEGKLVGKKVKLSQFQRRFMIKIYDNPAGTRRAIFSVARKNAKTALSAFILLLHIVGPEAVQNSQQYSTAQSKEQAAVIFELAAKIIRMSPELSPFCVVRDTVKQILCPERGTKYRALSAEVKTSFGLSPALTIHDELGQARGPKSELYSALETASAAQEEPLTIIISTQAPTDNDLLSILIDDALEDNDPCTIVELYTADTEADPFALTTIKQANPAYDEFMNTKEVLRMAADAKRMPSLEADYRNLILNQRVESTSPFVSRITWEACGAEPVSLEEYAGQLVFAGLDLSATSDLTALVLLFMVRGVWQVHCYFWLPEEGIAERSRLDRVQYDVWAKEGYIELTPGKSVEYEYVAQRLRELCTELKVKKIAFDRWNYRHLKPWLLKCGFTEKELETLFEEFGQGFQSMSPALRSLEALLLNKKLAHGKNPVLSMCAHNAVVQKDPAGNRKLSKAKSRGRIDGMVSLAMASAIAEATTEEKPKEFQMMFV